MFRRTRLFTSIFSLRFCNAIEVYLTLLSNERQRHFSLLLLFIFVLFVHILPKYGLKKKNNIHTSFKVSLT